MSSLLRSTKFVRYFSGAARTLILSSAKTTEANLLINPKALSAVNNFTLRDYATSKKNESLEPLLQKLDSEVRRFGRITKRDIDEVFDEIRVRNDITSSQSLLVIRCCGDLVPEELPEQRTLLVQKIWNVLNERGVPMDVSHYNALLRVYIENEHPFSPAMFLEEMERKGLQPNRVTYQRLMWRYCQEGDIDGATKVLEKMRELSMPVSEPVLNALVMGHAYRGDTDGAKAVLETMAVTGLQPTNKTYALLACGYARQGDIKGVESVLATAKDKDTYLTDKDMLDIIEQLAVGGHEDKVDQIIPHLHKATGYNQEVCNLILRLLNKNLESTAKKIMKTMPKSPSTEDTMFKGAFYIKQLMKLNKPADKIVQSCRELQDEGLIPSAIYIATETALQQGPIELAQKLFKEFQKDGHEIRQHYYWPLLVRKGKERDEEGLLQLIKDMTNNGLTLSGESLRDYVIPYLIKDRAPQDVIVKLQLANISPVHSSRNVMVELLEAGKIKDATKIALQYTPRGQYAMVARSLIGALNKTKDIESFVTILHVISSSFVPNQDEDVHEDTEADDKVKSNELGRIVNSAVKILVRDNLAEQLLAEVLSKGLKISTNSAEEIEQYIGDRMTTKISELLAQLTSPDLEIVPVQSLPKFKGQRSTEQLENLIEQLEKKEGSNINHLYKQLLTAYIDNNNVEKVDALLEKLKSSSFEMTNATIAALYEFYCEKNKVDKANEMQALLASKSPEFQLNIIKKIQMAYALVRLDRYEEAIEFLKNNKPTDSDKRSFIGNSKLWQLLNTLAEKKDTAKVIEMTNTLLDNSYIDPHNVILGPSIKVYLLNNDIEGALKQFEHCCKQYRSTPWKGELMKHLIMTEDAAKLQWLADLSTEIHGEVNILHDLVLAFVECGRVKQARRILETPGLHARHRRLYDACERYVEEGKSEYLESLLKATKELSHIDRSNIFYHLLVTYCKANETDKALGLWTLLQEEGEVPSDQFLLHLGKHLRSRNQPVPFVMPHEEKSDVTNQKPIKARSIRNPQKPTKTDVSTHIEKLIQDDKTSLAFEYTMKALEGGLIPKARILKFLLKTLALEGNVEKISALGKYLNESMRKKVAYDDKLNHAIIIQGMGPQHINDLLSLVKVANTEEDLIVALRKFPRAQALAIVIQNEELFAKCLQVAEIAASKGKILPANLLWMELLLAGREKEADSIWQQHLSNNDLIVFRRLLQDSHENSRPEVMEKLIKILKTNKNISDVSLGNVYSRLINFYLGSDKLEQAKAAIQKAREDGITEEHLNKNTVDKMKAI